MTRVCALGEFICSHNHALKTWNKAKSNKINELKVGTVDAL